MNNNTFFLDHVQLNSVHFGAHSYALENKVYSNIPESKCLGCPMSGGAGCEVVAECCRKASPPLYYIEFIYAYQNIEKWSKDKRKELLFKCFEAILNKDTEKPCVFLDQKTNRCNIYKYRWTNCRTYGMIPDAEWINRAKQWVKEVLTPKFSTKKKVKEKRGSSKLDGVGDTFVWVEKDIVDEAALDKYINEELFAEGFNVDRINDILATKWGISHFKVYEQCKNIKLNKPFLCFDKVYENLRKIEKSFVCYDINQDDNNSTYLAFHVYMLLFTIGEERVNYLIEIRNNWSEEDKAKFLEDIKNNIDSIVVKKDKQK